MFSHSSFDTHIKKLTDSLHAYQSARNVKRVTTDDYSAPEVKKQANNFWCFSFDNNSTIIVDRPKLEEFITATKRRISILENMKTGKEISKTDYDFLIEMPVLKQDKTISEYKFINHKHDGPPGGPCLK